MKNKTLPFNLIQLYFRGWDEYINIENKEPPRPDNI